MLLGVIIHCYWEADDLNRDNTWLDSVWYCKWKISPEVFCFASFLATQLVASGPYNLPVTAMGSGS